MEGYTEKEIKDFEDEVNDVLVKNHVMLMVFFTLKVLMNLEIESRCRLCFFKHFCNVSI